MGFITSKGKMLFATKKLQKDWTEDVLKNQQEQIHQNYELRIIHANSLEYSDILKLKSQ